jgi:prevent-host-death family protein
MRLGLREANQRFSKAIKAVKAGEDVVLTERGKPIAVISSLPVASRGDKGLRRLEAVGLLRPAQRPTPMPPFRPRPIKGEPLSETIRKEREQR